MRSSSEDYPDLYLPPPCDKDLNDITTFPKLLDLEIQRPLNDPNRLQDTLVELYSILGIPQEPPPITKTFSNWKDQSTPPIPGQDEQLTKQQAHGIKRMLPEEEMETSKRVKEEKEDQVPSTSSQKCRKRTLYNKQQTLFLQKQFDFNPYPDYVSRCCFAQVTGIPEPRIQVWFQNRRARHLSKSSTSQEAGSAESVIGKPFKECEGSPYPKIYKNFSSIPLVQSSKSNGHPS
ncbi:homeobox protein siamois-like isoform X3 [Engystomops pustulosus]|uniref:homeobox protein siamois-like isoform X3 n=1 Tax=Engystomops pustulosus TaxID=76066 RepID=UPI003AFACF23